MEKFQSLFQKRILDSYRNMNKRINNRKQLNSLLVREYNQTRKNSNTNMNKNTNQLKNNQCDYELYVNQVIVNSRPTIQPVTCRKYRNENSSMCLTHIKKTLREIEAGTTTMIPEYKQRLEEIIKGGN